MVHLNFKNPLFFLSLLFVLFSCGKAVTDVPSGYVCIGVRGNGYPETKTTAVTEVPSSLWWCVTTGTAGSETQVKAPASSSLTDGMIETDVAQPGSVELNYYVSNASMSFSSAKTTMSVSNATDVVYGHLFSSTSVRPVVNLYHVFGRTGAFTLVVPDGTSLVSSAWTIRSKGAVTGTSGVFNLTSGSFESATTMLSEQAVTGTSDLYLIPGTYTVKCSYVLNYGGANSPFVYEGDVVIEAGKILGVSLDTVLNEIQYGYSIEAWAGDSQALGQVPLKNPFVFGGLEIAPGNLYKTSTGYAVADSPLDGLDTFASKYGADTEGSYYFNFIEMGKVFDADGSSFTTSSGDIDNANTVTYDGKQWRMPTRAEWCTLTTGASPGTSRAGSSVTHGGGSASGVKYYKVLVDLTGSAYAGKGLSTYTTNGGGSSTFNATNYQAGLLLFPDNATITTAYSFPTAANTTSVAYLASDGSGAMNYTQFTALLDQGCAFLPASGSRYSGSWYRAGNRGLWWSATRSSASDAYNLYFNSGSLNPSNDDDKSAYYFPVRLVRTK